MQMILEFSAPFRIQYSQENVISSSLSHKIFLDVQQFLASLNQLTRYLLVYHRCYTRVTFF